LIGLSDYPELDEHKHDLDKAWLQGIGLTAEGCKYNLCLTIWLPLTDPSRGKYDSYPVDFTYLVVR